MNILLDDLRHTPGPWHVSAWGDTRVVVRSDAIPFVADCGRDTLPWVHANARLIAAAPDMLKALILAEEALVEGARSVIALMSGGEANVEEAIANPTPDSVLYKVREAIRRARE